MELRNDIPGLLRCFGVVDELDVFVIDHALICEALEINHAVPILPAVQDHGDLLHAACLAKAERVEQLVERAEAARENDERRGPQHEVEFPHREIVKLKA